MFVLTVQIQIKPEHRAEFLDAMLENARHSLADEPGCLRFDVIQGQEDPNRLFLYEIYRDQAAFEQAHLSAPHFIKWRDTVRDWHAVPPVSWRGTNVFPAGADIS